MLLFLWVFVFLLLADAGNSETNQFTGIKYYSRAGDAVMNSLWLGNGGLL
jgi:hypothetical protein